MDKLISALFFFAGLACISAQVLQFGQCEKFQAKQNFEANRYLGKWFEQQKYFAIFELGGKCINAQYSLRDDGKIGVFNTQTQIVSNTLQTIEGYAEFTEGPTVGKLAVTFPNVPAKAAPYWVLETDYDNYVLVWGCQEWFGIFSTKTAWILTRAQNPSETVIQTALDAAKRIGLNTNLFLKTDQQNCPARTG